MKIHKNAKNSKSTLSAEMYTEICGVCGLDPVVEMFNMVAEEYNFPEAFIKDVLARIDRPPYKNASAQLEDYIEKIITLTEGMSDEELEEVTPGLLLRCYTATTELLSQSLGTRD